MMTSSAHKLKKPEPAEVEYKNMRFLITYCPTDTEMDKFIEELKKHHVKDVVRVCDPTYNTQRLLDEGIRVVIRQDINPLFDIQRRFLQALTASSTCHCPQLLPALQRIDLPFDDGTAPPNDVITEWFNIVRTRFSQDSTGCVACHCVAGLGRAPVLVALALIELGMKYEDAVELIRDKRRGAINAKQLAYLEKYRPKSRLKLNRSNGHSLTGPGQHPNCAVM